MKDAKHIFTHAKSIGESKIVDRILVRVLPELIKYDKKITSTTIEESEELLVPDELYSYIRDVARELTGVDCCNGEEGVNV